MTPTSGVDVLGLGSSTTASLVGTNAGITGSANRLRRDGTLIARNSFDRTDLHRVDVRLQKRFKLSSRVTFDAIAEVFNMFNHANYNAFVTNEAAANYGVAACTTRTSRSSRGRRSSASGRRSNC